MVTKSNSPIFTIFGQCGFYQPCIWITGFVLVSATSHLKFKENVPLRVVRITQSDISKPNFFIMGGLPFPRPLSYNMMQMRRLENWARLAPSVMAIIHTLSQRPLKLFTQKDRGSIPTKASNREFILWSKSLGYPPPSPEPVESQTAPCTSSSSRAVQSKTCLPLSHCAVLFQPIVNATLWFDTSKLSQCCGENKQ